MSQALAVVANEAQPLAVAGELRFTPEQERMIRETYSTGATESEFQVLMEIAKARKLNPLLKQVHFVKRKDKKLNRDVWSVQVSIDGLRAIAERTRAYDGQDEPEYEYNERKEIILARVRVYKKGVSRPFVGVARWDEYVQKTYEGNPTKFWADMPFTMLAKCAEALAIRKAFPEDSAGLYVQEEMMQSESPARLTPNISPHLGPGESFDDTVPDSSAYEAFKAELVTVDDSIAPFLVREEQANNRVVFHVSPDFNPHDPRHAQVVLFARDELGSKAKQSALTKAIQAAGETGHISPAQRADLSKGWAHVSRKVEKLEKVGAAREPGED